MTNPIDLPSVADQPILILLAWTSFLGLMLLLPGSLAAAAVALRGLGGRLMRRPDPATSRAARLSRTAPSHRLAPRG